VPGWDVLLCVVLAAASCRRGPRLSLLPFNACFALSKHPASNLEPILDNPGSLLVSYMPLANSKQAGTRVRR